MATTASLYSTAYSGAKRESNNPFYTISRSIEILTLRRFTASCLSLSYSFFVEISLRVVDLVCALQRTADCGCGTQTMERQG